jgi:hypothetical protein
MMKIGCGLFGLRASRPNKTKMYHSPNKQNKKDLKVDLDCGLRQNLNPVWIVANPHRNVTNNKPEVAL